MDPIRIYFPHFFIFCCWDFICFYVFHFWCTAHYHYRLLLYDMLYLVQSRQLFEIFLFFSRFWLIYRMVPFYHMTYLQKKLKARTMNNIRYYEFKKKDWRKRNTVWKKKPCWKWKISDKRKVNNIYAANSHKTVEYNKIFYYLVGIRLIRADSYYHSVLKKRNKYESNWNSLKNQNKLTH